MSKKLPAIPGLGDVPENLKKILGPIKEILENSITVDETGNYTLGGASGADGGVGPPGPPGTDGSDGSGYDPGTDTTQPIAITELRAIGMSTLIMLQWSSPIYLNHSHTVLYRLAASQSTTGNNINDINVIQLALPAGTLYSDRDVVDGETYYYWAKFVSMAGVDGPLYPTGAAGVEGKIQLITSTQIDENAVTTPHLDAKLITGEVAYIDTEYIVTSMIGDLQVTNAKIGNVIQSLVYNPAAGVGWYIDKLGYATFAQIKILDKYGNIVLQSGHDTDITLDGLIDNRQLEYGANMLFNSQMYPHDSGWLGNVGNGATASHYVWSSLAYTDEDGWAISPGVTSVYQTNNNQTGHYDVICEPYFPISANEDYQVSARVGAHRCIVYVYAVIYNSNHASIQSILIGSNLGTYTGGSALDGGASGTGWQLIQKHLGTISANAAYIRVLFRKFPTLAGQSNSYAFYTHAFVAKVNPIADDVFAPYTPAPEALGIYNPIRPGNASTYIESAAITSAMISELWVSKIYGDVIKQKGDDLNYYQLEYDTGNQICMPDGCSTYHLAATVDIESNFVDREYRLIDPLIIRYDATPYWTGDSSDPYTFTATCYIQIKRDGQVVGDIEVSSESVTFYQAESGVQRNFLFYTTNQPIFLSADFDHTITYNVRVTQGNDPYPGVGWQRLSVGTCSPRVQLMKWPELGEYVNWSVP